MADTLYPGFDRPYRQVNVVSEDVNLLNYVAPTFTPATPAEEPEQMGEFRKGVMRGIDELQALGGGAVGLAGDIANVDIIRDFGYDIYKNQMAEAGQYAPAVETMYDINSIDSFLDWVAGTAGSVLPSVAGAVASGGAGSLLGGGVKTLSKTALKKAVAAQLKKSVRDKVLTQKLTKQAALAEVLKEFGGTASGKIVKNTLENAATATIKQGAYKGAKLGAQAGVVGFSSAVESGGNWIDDFETNGAGTNPIGDLLFGIASGATDLFGGEGMAISALFGKSVGKNLTKKLGEEGAKQVQNNFAKLFITEVGKGMLAEGGQEGLQESLGILNSYLNTNSIDAVLTPEVFKQVSESMAAGAVGGAMFGTPSGVGTVFSAKEHAARVQNAELARQEEELRQKQALKEARENTRLKEYDIFLQKLDEDLLTTQQATTATMIAPQPQAQQRPAGVTASGARTAQASVPQGFGAEQWAKLASLEKEKKKVQDLRAKSLEKLNQIQLDNSAEMEDFQNRVSQEVSQRVGMMDSKNIAYSSLDGAISRANEKLTSALEYLYKAGAPEVKIQKLKGMWNSLSAIKANTVETIAKMPEYESFRIDPYTNEQLAKISKLTDQIITESEWKPTTPEDQRSAAEQSFQREQRSALQELRDAEVVDAAKAREQRTVNNEMKRLVNEFSRPHPSLRGNYPAMATPAESEFLAASQAPREVAPQQRGMMDKPELADLSSEEERVRQVGLAYEQNKRNLVREALNTKRRVQKKKLLTQEQVNAMTQGHVQKLYDEALSGKFGKEAKDLIQGSFGQAFEPATPVPAKMNNALSVVFQDKSLAEARTIYDVTRTLADKLSGKGMPYTNAEAKMVLRALLPQALNLKPMEGAKWLRDSLFITPYLVESSAVQKGFDSTNAADRGAYARKQGKIIISMLKAADKSTFLHEAAHAYLDNLTEKVNQGWATERDLADFAAVKKWLNFDEKLGAFTRAQHEQFARGFEKYLMTAKAPNSMLERFFNAVKRWLLKIYKTADALNVKLSPAAARVYKHMLLKEPKGTKPAGVKPKSKVKVSGDTKKQTSAQMIAGAAKKAGTKIAETAKEVKEDLATASLRAQNKKGEMSFVTDKGLIDYTFLDVAKENLQDYYHPIRLLVKAVTAANGVVTPTSNVYKIEEAIPNILVDRLKEFNRSMVEPLIADLQKYAKEAKAAGVSNKDVLQHVDKYLHALHADERNKKIKSQYKGEGPRSESPSGMSKKEADAILKGGTEIQITPALEKIAKGVKKITTHQIEMMREYALLPKSQINAIEKAYDNYVPLKGWDEMMEDVMHPEYKNRVRGVTLSLKRALGREEGSAAESPLVHAILQTMDTISVGMRAESGRALLELINDNKNNKSIDKFFFEVGTNDKIKSSWQPDNKGNLVYKAESVPFSGDKNVITVIDRDGEKVRLKAKDERIANAFTGNNLAVAGPVLKFMGSITRMIAKLATTLNPAFIYTNPIRDISTALLNITDEKLASGTYPLVGSSIRRTLLKTLPMARRAIADQLAGRKQSNPEMEWYINRFRAYGGFSEQYDLNDFNSIAAGLEKAVKKSTQDKSNVLNWSMDTISKAFEFLEKQSNVFENMTRLATFKTLYDGWRKSGMLEKEALARAASASRNITVNFTKRGAWAPVISPLFMFANASIQGTARMFKTMARNKAAMTKILAGGIVGVALMAQMNREVGGDDDDGVSYYDKIPAWTRNTNLIFMIPGTKGKYVKIPLPYGYNVFNVIGQSIDQVVTGRETAFGASAEIVNSMFDNFSPVGSPEAGWTTLLPTIMRPPFQIATNKGFFGQKIMPDVPTWIKYDYPDANRYWSSINPVALGIARGLNALGQTTKTRPGIIDVSPETIEHYIESYTGGLGKTISRAVGAIATTANALTTDGKTLDMAETISELPVARRFYGMTNFYSTLHEYNNVRAEIAALEQEYKDAKAAGREEFVAFKANNPNVLSRIATMKAADKKLRKYSKLKNSIMKSKSAANEAARLEKIRSTEQKAIKDAIKKLRSLED